MNNPQTHVFLVDDDAELRTLTANYLEQNGVHVTAIASGDEAIKRLARLRPQLIVLDVMMPGTDGLSVCRQLRGQGDLIPIIMLTARKDEVDRVIGLEMGADDYLGKPFSPRELLARIHAVLRRQHAPPGTPVDTPAVVAMGDWTFHLATRTLKRGGEEVVLSSAEYALLKALVERPRQPLSRDLLLELSRNRGADITGRAIDVAIFRLRRLIERDPAIPRYIQTMRGHGYLFVPDEHA